MKLEIKEKFISSQSSLEQEKKFLGKMKEQIVNLEKYSSQPNFGEKYRQLRDQLIKENPDCSLMITALFEIGEMAQAEKRLSVLKEKRKEGTRIKGRGEKIRQLIRSLTEGQFTLTYFLIQLEDQPEFAQSFWTEAGELYRLFSQESFKGYKKGIIGQTGVYHLMNHFGLKPKISHPDEDAFDKTDLWLSYPGSKEALALQTKYTQRTDKPIFLSTEEISWPSILHYGKEKHIYISHKDIHEMMHLKQTCEAITSLKHKPTIGFYFACPDGSFDGLTGKPKEKFLREVQPEIEKHFKRQE